MTELLSKDHRILEKGLMDCRPFGTDLHGEKIRDVSGVTVRANVEYLQECVARAEGPQAGERAVEELCRLLNERIRDRAYHVTPKFLLNVWNSYSYEFVCFLGEFCKTISKDPKFQFHVGQEKFISPIIQTLGRPFSLPQIYKMFPHFGEKFAKGSIHFEVGAVTNRSAVLRMKFTDKVYQQFGPYRKSCAELICQSAKAGLAAVPERVHHLRPAAIKDRSCIADGAEYCEWEFTWVPQASGRVMWLVAGLLVGASLFGYLRLRHQALGLLESLVIAFIPVMVLWLASTWRFFHKEVRKREQLIQEQLRFVEARHEELREAYLEQEQATVELRRKVSQLTTLHRAGLIFSSSLNHEEVLQTVLQAILHDLHYDRAMISFYDRERRVSHDARVIGVSDELAAFARSLEVPITDPSSLEGMVLLHGKPILVGDIRQVWDWLHPLNQQLAAAAKAKSIISVPLKVKDRIIGCITVDRTQEHALTQDDLDLMVTMANHVAIALDNADAYRQIEELNIGLESKVRDRTAALERLNQELAAANEQLKQMDRLKSQFLSHVSHELRSPLTSIKGFVDNLLNQLAGPLADKQERYLKRVQENAARLTRMIADLLDLARIEAGKIELSRGEVSLPRLTDAVVEQLRVLALAKRLHLVLERPESDLTVWGDADRLTQVMTNLVDNAIKYTPEDGQITVQVSQAGPDFAKLSVMDTGVGIPAESLSKVFEPFFQLGRQPAGGVKGLGLGLSIVKHLVELHGGRVSVNSEAGKGTAFHVTLPVRPPSASV